MLPAEWFKTYTPAAPDEDPCPDCGRAKTRQKRGLCAQCYYLRKRLGVELPPLRTLEHRSFLSRYADARAGRSDNECWPWGGSIDKDGYGDTRYGYASRLAYAHERGAIPAGMTIEHACHTRSETCTGGPTCRHRRCVNPAHLMVLSRLDNAALAKPKTRNTCKRQHDRSVFGVKDRNGAWRCRACTAQRKRERRRARC